MASAPPPDDTSPMPGTSGVCPNCGQGDLITISMAVSEQDLMFTTCHLCEAKWWYQKGELVPLSSVIDLVVKK
jgi:formate dehydrogenase maturation protein FdhE